ncbi:hypothetical protein [Actinophytocola gossypii]|uniref:PE domain-containing protein n=1 Tax=Actinophytocola gossypii TaxID=2812003 RepID=A0ABT2J5H7_9PSEU|nr:hypothetical protein [Actinophytocola gossypii]MCT2583038.1 hypothetical protein [Actinophytocola gossypii]
MDGIEVGAAGSGVPIPEYRMIVPPDKLLTLKKGIEDERDRLRNWLIDNEHKLRDIPPPGSDPCSIDTMKIMSENCGQAADAVWAYVDRLDKMATKLGETAATYGLVEDENTAKFREEPS